MLDLDNDFFKWLKFLEYKDMEVIERMAKENKFINDAKKEMFILTAEQEEKNYQRFRENYLIDRKFDRAEFLEIGRKEGKKEGITIGKRQSLLNFARKMLIEKYNIQEIIKLTGLSENEINKLAKTI